MQPNHTDQDIDLLKNTAAPLLGVSYDDKIIKGSPHQHCRAQLMYCSMGVVELRVAEQVFLVPPTNGVWIPSSIPHEALSEKMVSFRSLYFDTNHLTGLPEQVQIITVSRLLRELILTACQFELSEPTSDVERHLTTVVIDQIVAAKQQPFSLSIPNDPLIQAIYNFVTENLTCKLTVDEVGKEFSMSGKSLNRVFQKQLGMTFEQWRQQIKILRAIALLSYGNNTSQVSQALGYSGDSAFIHQFKRITGKTPKAFRQ